MNTETQQLTTRQRRINAGVCVDCLSPALTTRYRCHDCSVKENAYQVTYRQKRRGNGICRFCVYPPKPGSAMCEVHLLRAAGYQAKMRKIRQKRRLQVQEAPECPK